MHEYNKQTRIYYKKRRKYKYNLDSDFPYSTGIKVIKSYKSKSLEIDSSGNLLIRAGYSWDGPSGPTIDTKTFMRGSLVHDALYQLMRERAISLDERGMADKILWNICREDGMIRLRRWWVKKGLEWFGERSAIPDLLTAP